jgi:serine phosphatase RsbU (regulator of sigma subunit)
MIAVEDIVYILIAVASLFFSGVLYYVFRLSRKVRDLKIENRKITSLLEIFRNENKILNYEVDKAKHMSKAFYPKREHIIHSKFDICGISVPSHKVSGDYYDVFTSSGNIYFGIGDVTGHGLSSSILSLMVSRRIRMLIDVGKKDITSIIEGCNNEIVTEATKYMSLLIGQITPGGRIETYGKQESIIIIRTSGLEIIEDEVGFILGNSSFSKESIPKHTLELDSNEFIVFYTDGVTELENSNKEALGVEGIKKFIGGIVGQLRYMSAAGICQEIVDFLTSWGAEYVEDDITLLVIKKK